MTGRPFLEVDESWPSHCLTAEAARRRCVLRETIKQFERCPSGDRYRGQASKNLLRWRRTAKPQCQSPLILVIPGDWGEVTRNLTLQFGECFAVLNMANAYLPGGRYVEGAIAQEENMYRRTDCHFYVAPPLYDADRDRYTPEATRLLSGEDGLVYLDSSNPRVCIRGPENIAVPDLGYRWLEDEEIFPFYELRAAAQNLSKGERFDSEKARRQIRAQIATLRSRTIKHVVFGAFGCGAFKNPAPEVARIYREEIQASRSDFAVIAFAIFNAGYGPDNYSPFKAELDAT